MMPGPIEEAQRLPNGARFYRCALQVNPHHYAGTFRGQPSAGNEDAYVEAIVSKCIDLGVEVIAVTDHNSISSVERFRTVGEQRDVIVFPGFELTSSENVHVLCIYERSTNHVTLERFLGEFGIHNPKPSSVPCNATFVDILDRVRSQGGVTIAAHVTQSNGLLTTLHGQACIRVWRDPNLLALQIPGSLEDTPDDKKPILKNKNAQYHRDPAAAPDLAVALVNAADVKAPDDLAQPGASCWVKMSEVSIEGLRQAFLDPTSRIRLASDGDLTQHAELVALAWEGGFLDEAAVHFNENLNVLIGGRGTGKSTVIESLRYVLGLDPLGDDAKKQFEGVLKYVLGSGTKVSLLLRSHYPAAREYLIERTVPNPPVVRDAQGAVLNVLPRDVAPRTEVYGQHEISELTKSPEKLTQLLERFVDPDPALPQRKADLRREMEKSRSRILEVRRELQQVDERLAALPALEETLKKFQDAGIETRLKDQSLLVREERVLRTAGERIEPLRGLVSNLERSATIDVAFLSPKALDGLPAKDLLRELEAVLTELSQSLIASVRAMEDALRRADGGVADVRSRWEVRKKAVQEQLDKILRELQRSKVDGQEFIRLRQQIEELRPLAERRTTLTKTVLEYEGQRRTLTTEWEELKRLEYSQIERAAKKVSKQLSGRVRVRVVFAGNRESLVRCLRELVGGTLAQTIEILKKDAGFSLPELVGACRAGADTLTKRYKMPTAQAQRLAGAEEEALMQIEELDLTPTTSIELNVAAEGQPDDWHSLEALSTGQKATAVLLLLLLESDAPLVVDQPEDDLDNRFITEGIVPKMRDEKRRRQFIFATHNANIPVLGDAELIVGLSTSADSGRVHALLGQEHMGSIDKPAVRTLVEEVLEGGKDAFETRRRKYRF